MQLRSKQLIKEQQKQLVDLHIVTGAAKGSMLYLSPWPSGLSGSIDNQ